MELGVERLLRQNRQLLKGKRVGLVTNYAVTDRKFRLVVDLLIEAKEWLVTKLFGPEHGMLGCAKEGEHVHSTVDPHTGLTAYSLYGDIQKPTAEMLENLDILVVDLIDIGVRYWTNIATTLYCIEACAELGMPCIILDRPNPISGVMREGNLLNLKFQSFVGFLAIPNRHGLTNGELALFYNSQLEKTCDLKVIPCSGWERSQMQPDTDIPLVSPTPNTTRFDMMLLYAGTCLFEGTNISEGRGTAHPFEVIGAPFANAHKVADIFNKSGLPGVIARPTYFVPTYKKYVGEVCEGVQLHVTDRTALKAVKTGLVLLEIFARLYPKNFEFLPPRAEDGRRFIDLLSGDDKLCRLVEIGRTNEYLQDLSHFNSTIQPFYLY